jgi:hypothetical protein
MAACDDELSDTVTKIVAPSLLQSPLSSSDFSSLAVVVLSPLVLSLRLRRRRLSRHRLKSCCVMHLTMSGAILGRQVGTDGPNKRKRKRTSRELWYEDARSKAPSMSESRQLVFAFGHYLSCASSVSEARPAGY